MALTFKKRLIPRPLLTVINFFAIIFFFICGFLLMSAIFILIGLFLKQSYYLLMNQNKGRETLLELFELSILYVIILLCLTKISEFFERQINKLLQKKKPNGKDFQPRLWSKPKVATFIIFCLFIFGCFHYLVLR